jgi:nucleoside-diphosphate-sugar epimerase
MVAESGSGLRVLLAGATGVIGSRLLPMLIADGHTVIATTTAPAKIEMLRALGAEAVVMDGLRSDSVGEAVSRTRPDAVIHQMTALRGPFDLRRFDRTFAQTNDLRTRGTDNLLAAANTAGVRRFIAQSFGGWPNARTGGAVKSETDPLDPDPPKAQRKTFAAIQHLEQAVIDAPLHGVVLRYGTLYGPGTSMADEYPELIRKRRLPIVDGGTGVWSFVHVGDAASATVRALEHGSPGVYNVVDDDPAPVADWLPYFAACLGAKPPRRVPVWLARVAAGEVGVSIMTQIRGCSNAKARRELGWEPRWPSWREGFRDALGASRRTGA